MNYNNKNNNALFIYRLGRISDQSPKNGVDTGVELWPGVILRKTWLNNCNLMVIKAMSVSPTFRMVVEPWPFHTDSRSE